jgi:hypothetical protein
MREAGRIEPIARRFDVDPFDLLLSLCQLPWQGFSQKSLRSLLGVVQALANRSRSSIVFNARHTFSKNFLS